MAKPKRKLTAAEKRAKKERRMKYQFIFINGKQVRVRRPETVDGIPLDEFIAQNADPIWLHQNEMWELIEPETDFLPNSAPADLKIFGETESNLRAAPGEIDSTGHAFPDDEIPF